MRLVFVLGVVCAVLGGCGERTRLHDRVTLGGRTLPGGFAPGPHLDIAHGERYDTLRMSRANWPAVEYVVPVDFTVHGPVFRVDRRAMPPTSRGRGRVPTVETALETSRIGPRGAVFEGVVAPVRASGQAVLLPLRVVGSHGVHPREQDRLIVSPGPVLLYKRVRQGRPVMFGPLPTEPIAEHE